ncbi:MAG: hypothetical protein KC517_04495 [Bacteroidetes bacterium]|jgi:hypothetical protein|nr:hypothetical protein [Bacteroidota bacterium]
MVKKCCLLICVTWLSATNLLAQLDTSSVLTGSWDLVQSSVGYGYLNRDSVESYSSNFNSNYTLRFTDRHIFFKSRTILEFLNDSIIEEVKFKRNRTGSFIRLRNRKRASFMYIQKLTYDELVLTERNEHTLPSLFVETKYYYKKQFPQHLQPNYNFIGKWLMLDTCQSCSFWGDTIALIADTSTNYAYGNNYYLTIDKNNQPAAKHNTFTLGIINRPEPDTSDPYSQLYGKLSFGKIATNRDWIFDFEQQRIYFYPNFISDEFLAYRIAECIPEEKLILIKQN